MNLRDRDDAENANQEAYAHDPQGVEDRVLDILLGEVLGGESPPDVSADVLGRVRPPHSSATRRSPMLWLGALAGAAAAWLVWSALGIAGVPPVRRNVPMHVVAGCLRWTAEGATVEVSAPTRVAWALSPSDRIAVCAAEGATTDLADLGRLQMDQATELEVRTMEWKPFATGVALGAVTVAVIHGAITWTSGGEVARAAAGDSIELRGAEGAPHSLAALTQRVAELEKDLRDERATSLALKAAAGRKTFTPDGAASGEGDPAEAAPTAVAMQHAVTYGGFESALGAIDWDATGEAMFKMTGQLEAMMKAIKEGGEMPLAVIAEIQQLNGELIKQAQALLDGKVPGTGVNGAFTHPVIAANQMFAALVKGGLPMTDAQRDGLQRLSSVLAGEDEARRSKLTGEEFGLEALLGEMEIKDRFYADARSLLTPEQEQALFHPHSDGTTSSLFSSGIAWAQFGQAIVATDRGDYASQVTDSLARDIGLGAEASAQLRGVVETWAKSVPDAAFATAAKNSRMAQISQSTASVRDAARRQVELYRELARTLPLTPEQKAALRKAHAVFVPYGRR